MPDGERLRELQRRAYGAGGGLNAEEAAELAELQARPSSRSARSGTEETGLSTKVETVPDPEPSPDPERGAQRRDEGHDQPEESEPCPDPERGAQRRDEGRSDPRKHRVSLVFAAVASALLIGLGAGWLLFGRDSGPAMDAKQQEAWSDFEASGKYDAGSIRMLGERYGITAWYATQQNAKTECIMLTPTKDGSIACQPTERPKGEEEQQSPLSAQIDLGDDRGTGVSGVVLRDVRGVPTVIMQKWDNTNTYDWTQMYDGDELAIAKVIVAKSGIQGEFLQIAGYDGTSPIWMTQENETCLYVADLGGITQKSCAPDTADVLLERPNAVFGLIDTTQGTRLTTLHGKGVKAADPAVQGSE
ncbi:hypothetical protein ACFVAE_06915 [Microbacterium sp. NPDC057659]|uniref:hypothetical protein n=1 Tax=Microbacterium sp. NPDC057659 TaxID=3346198 RepID=UPI00366E71CD